MSTKKLPEQLLIITDPLAIKQSVKAIDVLCVLWDFDQYLRGLSKYQDIEVAEEYREKLREYMDQYNISFEELLP